MYSTCVCTHEHARARVQLTFDLQQHGGVGGVELGASAGYGTGIASLLVSLLCQSVHDARLAQLDSREVELGRQTCNGGMVEALLAWEGGREGGRGGMEGGRGRGEK